MPFRKCETCGRRFGHDAEQHAAHAQRLNLQREQEERRRRAEQEDMRLRQRQDAAMRARADARRARRSADSECPECHMLHGQHKMSCYHPSNDRTGRGARVSAREEDDGTFTALHYLTPQPGAESAAEQVPTVVPQPDVHGAEKGTAPERSYSEPPAPDPSPAPSAWDAGSAGYSSGGGSYDSGGGGYSGGSSYYDSGSSGGSASSCGGGGF